MTDEQFEKINNYEEIENLSDDILNILSEVGSTL